MFNTPSLTVRIAIGKGVGFLFGLIGFLSLPLFLPDIGWLPRIGILLWYPLVGAVIGVFGVYTWHPILKLPMPWWFRAPLIGGWMNFVLTFFAYNLMGSLTAAVFGSVSHLQTVLLFTCEGILVGLLIGYLATKIGGEGASTLDR